MQNYFEHFGIPIAHEIDLSLLRKKYYEKSREFHPDINQNKPDLDFHTAYNNQAYKILLNPLSRLKYIIELTEGPIQENTQTLPQEFLIQMMELHEAIFEAKELQDTKQLNRLMEELSLAETNAQNKIHPIFRDFDQGNRDPEILNQMKFYYFKLKYFIRLRENLSNSESEI
ncbi:MAG: iron-sulfur cluster co-chaperone HscB C-terminal domain-containing protein [Saprospiraceae bacterium]|jgi:molecular chaperone HscB